MKLEKFVQLFRCTKCKSEKGLILKKNKLECKNCGKTFTINKEQPVFL